MPTLWVPRAFGGTIPYTTSAPSAGTPDIDGPILAALLYVFTLELQQTQSILKTLKQADLQDDPTLTAPYLVFRDDPQKGQTRILGGELAKQYGSVEIGGPVRYLHHFKAKYGTPLATTRNQARVDIATLEARVEDVLFKYFSLANTTQSGMLTSTDNTRRIEGANTFLIDDMEKRIYGGEQTFYGEGTMCWHYPVSRFRTIPPGTLA